MLIAPRIKNSLYLLCLVTSSIVSANTEQPRIVISRYQTVEVYNASEPHDLLSVVMDVTFANRVHTIGGALTVLLASNGYRLNEEPNDNAQQYILFALPLPQAYRQWEAITLNDALSLLAGEAFTPVINPVTRAVSFTLNSMYEQYSSLSMALQAKEFWLGQGLPTAIIKSDESTTHHVPVSKPLEHHGPVLLGDTLTQITQHLYWEQGSTDQKLVALFNANRHAFNNDNMNTLLLGAMLTLPRENVDNLLSVEEAKAVVNEHYQVWRSKKDNLKNE